jgi:adenosylcobyric acid synthase
MVQGTSSGSGKSLIVTALCRILHNKGFNVAPFKSQNMSSFTYNIQKTDKIIAKAQAIQAIGSKINPDIRMNPILLKPVGNNESEIFLNGSFYSKMNAKEYYSNFVLNKGLNCALRSFNSLQKEHDIIILEGAGSPAEINIMKFDIANMIFAKKVNAPVLLVSDIERGGSFASILGTISILKPKYRKLIRGILINKFRGDKEILQPAVKYLEKKVKKPIVGVIPKINHFIPEEDSLDSTNNKKDNDKSSDLASLDSNIDMVSNILEKSIKINYIIEKILR